MISPTDLYDIAKSRFEEAKLLNTAGKFEGAVYLCGYALELMLKRYIVLNLSWDGYPETSKEFESFKTFKTHDLDVLLRLAGLEKKIQIDKSVYAAWQTAKLWKSEIRYKKVGSVVEKDAENTIEATRTVINNLLLNI